MMAALKTLLMLGYAAVAVSGQTFTPVKEPSSTIAPDWDFVPAYVDKCVDASASSTPENVRWVTYALPTSKAPASGFPVYLDLVTDNYPVPGKTCGDPGHVRKTYTAFATPKSVMEPCYNSSLSSGDACSDAMATSCAASAKSGFPACFECGKSGPEKSGTCSAIGVYEWCKEHSGGGPPSGGCRYDQEAGAMWDHRLKQLLVSNGVAYFNVNPISEDSWDAFPAAWDGYTDRGQNYGGVDKPFLKELFKQMKSGEFGNVNVNNVVVRGWSSGAQMVSWLFQVMANNTDPDVFPMKQMVGGVMLSGGSYQCYNDAQGDPPVNPIGSCKTCQEGGPSHCENDPACSSCSPTVQPYCQQCCPKNYTEQYWEDHPTEWNTHPPVFLAQTSTEDNHADLCACKNYYNTLQNHGVTSVLALVPKEDESCFCVGNPSNPDAAGSPWSSKCSDPNWGKDCSLMGGPECCISHTFGFASMMQPALNFVLNVTKSQQ